MAIDFQSVRQQIKKMGEKAPARAQEFQEKRADAAAQLEDHAKNPDLLRQRVDAALTLNPSLRTAVPRDEALNASYPLPEMPATATLLAADGSQIYPDRHGPTHFSLINVGGIMMTLGAAQTPSQTITSELLYDDDLYTESGRITESLVALMRDLGERELLAELAEGLPGPVITLTDGPLELWEPRDVREGNVFYEDKFEKYLDALRKLNALGASTAGYIDKPGSDLLVRLLEIAKLKATELDMAGKMRPYLGLTDINLLEGILGLYERSAILGIQSKSAARYADDLAVHFFYINVGSTTAGTPYLARVEIPAWVADRPEMVNTLHAVLIQQCRALGTRPYPYLLHRSHEVAVVTHDEKRQVESMISFELRKRGVYTGTQSYKSAAKEAGSRGRYGS